jgi:hypothetical protein
MQAFFVAREEIAPGRQRVRHHAPPREDQHVEDVVEDRRLRTVVLKHAKGRQPGLVERNHFAVDHGLVRQPGERLRNPWILCVEILVVP